jgi:hypothetical protein
MIAYDSSSAAGATIRNRLHLTNDLERYALRWSYLPVWIQEHLWNSNPGLDPVLNSRYWMWNQRRTYAAQDPTQHSKFPASDYLPEPQRNLDFRGLRAHNPASVPHSVYRYQFSKALRNEMRDYQPIWRIRSRMSAA